MAVLRKPPNSDAIAPVPEKPAYKFNAYRGIENHGVPIQETWDEPAGYDSSMVLTEVRHHEPDPSPVPVYLVNNDDTRQITKWRNATGYADNTPRQIIGQLETRTVLRVYNPSVDRTVFVSPDSSVSVGTGYPILPGKELILHATGEMWAVSDTGVSVTLNLFYEFTVKI